MSNESGPKPENPDYDLVVVGNGFGGATAALSFLKAAERAGKAGRAALVEAGPRGTWTGASQWAKPMLRLTRDEGLARDRDDRIDPDDLEPVARDYWRAFEDGVPETAAFMAENKAWLGHRDEPDAALDFEGGHYGYLMGGGKGVLDSLLTRITVGADLYFEHETVELVHDEDIGGVSGVVVQGPDGTRRRLTAGAVVLASGGFAGDPDRLDSSLGDGAADVPTLARGLRFNRGTGLQMALDVGAATVGRFDAAHAQLVDARSDEDQALLYGQNYGIVVNADAERFVDEGGDYVFAVTEAVADATWRHQQGRSWFVTDATVMDRFAGSWVYGDSDVPPERADTVAGLAEVLGLDPSRLAATVEEFNAGCAADGPGDWDPTRLDGNATSGLTPPKSNWAIPLVSPPFAGFPMTAQISSTFGGLRVDAHSHVLDTDGDAIPGLYAVGEITGHVHDRHLAATSVLRAMNFGRIVGQDVAASLPESATGASAGTSPGGTTRKPDSPPTRAWAGVNPVRGIVVEGRLRRGCSDGAARPSAPGACAQRSFASPATRCVWATGCCGSASRIDGDHLEVWVRSGAHSGVRRGRRSDGEFRGGVAPGAVLGQTSPRASALRSRSSSGVGDAREPRRHAGVARLLTRVRAAVSESLLAGASQCGPAASSFRSGAPARRSLRRGVGQDGGRPCADGLTRGRPARSSRCASAAEPRGSSGATHRAVLSPVVAP